MHIALVVAAYVWNVMAPTWVPPNEEGFDFCRDSTGLRDSIIAIRLYVSERWSDGSYRFAREHPITTGQRDTFLLDDSPPGRTYAAFAVSGRNGLESRCPTLRTVGIPATSVEEGLPIWNRVAWFDVSGRRLHLGDAAVLEASLNRPKVTWLLTGTGLPSGVYFRREVGPRAIRVRRVVVLR